MSEKNHVAPKLKRTMTAGQMEMISLGGAIDIQVDVVVDWLKFFIKTR